MKKSLLGILLVTSCTSPPSISQELKPSEQWYGHKWLLERGVPMKFVAQLYPDLALRISVDFEDKVVPQSWLSELSFETWKNTDESVRNSSDNKKNRSELIREIEVRMNKRAHSFRTDAGYTENSFAVDKINDKILLVSIKNYLD